PIAPSASLATALVVACTAAPRIQATPQPIIDTTLVFVADSGSSTTFPLLPARVQGEAFLADPDAPSCGVSPPPDTSAWRVNTTTGHSRYIHRISLLLPATYEPFARAHLP